MLPARNRLNKYYKDEKISAGSRVVVRNKHTCPGRNSIKKTPLTFSAYAEVYYSYDFGEPGNHTKPSFLYNHNKHNELNLNLGLLKAAYSTDRVRANLGLMAGTYATANLAAETDVMRHVYEANVGYRLGHNLWLDAGIMPSHIGFESAVGKDCPTLTRSLSAENTPYYETGAKITWNNDQWTVAAMYLNGWQRIRRPDGNQTPALGTQVAYKPNSAILVNWSTFIGNDKADSVKQMRYFSDLYGVLNVTEKFTLTAGFDYGMEQKSEGLSGMNKWYSITGIARIALTEKLAMAARGEYYHDENGVIVATGLPDGFRVGGYSLNLDLNPVSAVMFRLEGKVFNSRNEIFTKGAELDKHNLSITAMMAVAF
ncbi:porin [Chitinophaga sedimenti]|nr:porin [Chitinophaga sedimenti]